MQQNKKHGRIPRRKKKILKASHCDDCSPKLQCFFDALSLVFPAFSAGAKYFQCFSIIVRFLRLLPEKITHILVWNHKPLGYLDACPQTFSFKPRPRKFTNHFRRHVILLTFPMCCLILALVSDKAAKAQSHSCHMCPMSHLIFCKLHFQCNLKLVST